MKKILAIFFAVALTAMLFSCGGKNNNGTGGNTGGAVGDIITDASDMIDDLMPGTNSTRRTTDMSTATPTIPGSGNATEGTNGTIPPSTGGGTTVR